MVGEGPEKTEAMAYVNKNGLNEKVLFLGNSNEIDKILCYSDLFLLPSEMESFGLVALEAMANEVPVISSNAGGLSEVNKHGVTGFLSEIGDVTSMAENALKLLLDDDKLKQFKKQAKEQAQLFDIDVVVNQYEEIYQKALEN
jgi:N-acetyl-alpha-D-glucosaminyl L-malate synthase BshA